MITKKYSIMELAHMILRDECPPDNEMYLCMMSDHEDCECERCWSNFLYWAQNGYDPERQNPYRCDRNIEMIENHGYFYKEGVRF